MKEALYRFKCLNCKWVWLSDDYDDNLPKYKEGHECPICKSTSVEGYEVK